MTLAPNQFITKKVSTFGLVLLLLGGSSFGTLQIKDHYSPLNAQRPVRQRTDYILLHTTEGPSKGSLNKLHRYGETHYFIDTGGAVYRVIDKRRIAMHAGRSMWNGRTDLDRSTIAIEVAGYHNRDITAAQYTALKELIVQLQALYKIPDEKVLTHSMVAYGAPNRWHKHSHRGRKRCGMLFAKHTVRTRLGLTKQPLFDPDVKAKRLVNADPHLAKVLYGSAKEQLRAATHFEGNDALVISPTRSAWDIARDKYRSAETLYVFPNGTNRKGNEITNWKAMPVGTKVVLSDTQSGNEAEGISMIGTNGDSATDIAGDEVHTRTTIYFLPDNRVKQGHELSAAEVKSLPEKTRVLVGYVHGGYITANRSAFDICGEKWNSDSTFYRFKDGRIVSGGDLSEGAIPPATMVFFQQ